jgi:hypothetical protein
MSDRDPLYAENESLKVALESSRRTNAALVDQATHWEREALEARWAMLPVTEAPGPRERAAKQAASLLAAALLLYRFAFGAVLVAAFVLEHHPNSVGWLLGMSLAAGLNAVPWEERRP